MASTRYGQKRRTRRAGIRARTTPSEGAAPAVPAPSASVSPRFVAVGTVASLSVGPGGPPPLSLVIGGRFELRVGAGFDATTLIRLIRTLEQV